MEGVGWKGRVMPWTRICGWCGTQTPTANCIMWQRICLWLLPGHRLPPFWPTPMTGGVACAAVACCFILLIWNWISQPSRRRRRQRWQVACWAQLGKHHAPLWKMPPPAPFLVPPMGEAKINLLIGPHPATEWCYWQAAACRTTQKKKEGLKKRTMQNKRICLPYHAAYACYLLLPSKNVYSRNWFIDKTREARALHRNMKNTKSESTKPFFFVSPPLFCQPRHMRNVRGL